MLLVTIKSIAIGDHVVKLYSLDGGKLWFSSPRDLRQFKLRKRKDEEQIRSMFDRHVPADLRSRRDRELELL